MYNLITLKGLVVPEGFASGKMNLDEAVSYLYDIGMEKDATDLLLSLKAIVVPPNHMVLWHQDTKSEPAVIPPNKGVPIFLGIGADWNKFVDFVNSQEGGKWEIQTFNPEDAGEYKKSKELMDNRLTGVNARALANMFHEYKAAIIAALTPPPPPEEEAKDGKTLTEEEKAKKDKEEEEQSVGRLEEGLLLAAHARRLLEELPPELSQELDVARDVMERDLSEIQHEAMLRMILSDNPDESFGKTDAGNTNLKIPRSALENIARMYRQQLKDTSEALSEMKGTWELDFEQGTRRRYTNAGILNKDKGKEYTTYTPILRKVSDEDGDNLDLIAAVALSHKVLSTEMIEAISQANGGVIRLEEDLGIDVSTYRSADTKSAITNLRSGETPASKEARLGALIAGGIKQFAINAYDSRKITRTAAELKNLSQVRDTFFRKSDSEAQTFYNNVAFTEMKRLSARSMAEVSDGVKSTTENFNHMVDKLGDMLAERLLDQGHEYMFSEREGLKSAMETALGIENIDTKRLDSALLEHDFSASKSDYEVGREVGKAAGLLNASQSKEGVADFGKLVRSMSELVEARKYLGHQSSYARLIGAYITDNDKYVMDMSRFVDRYAGADAKLDNYSMSYVGSKGVVPLSTAMFLFGYTYGDAGDFSVTEDIMSACLDNISPPLPMSERERLMDRKLSVNEKLKWIARGRGLVSTGGVYLNILRNAGGIPGSIKLAKSDDSRFPETALKGLELVFTKDMYGLVDNFVKSKNVEEATQAKDNVVSHIRNAFAGPASKLGRSGNIIVEGMTKYLDAELSASISRAAASSKKKFSFGAHAGTYFETVQIAAIAFAEMMEHGARKISFSTTEDKTKTRSLYEKVAYTYTDNGKKEASKEAYDSATKLTWVDKNGDKHVMHPNYTEGGAIDATYAIISGSSMTLKPIEFKMSKGTVMRAHVGDSKAFRRLARVMAYAEGATNTTIQSALNMSTITPGKQKASRNRAEYLKTYVSGMQFNRSGIVLPGLVGDITAIADDLRNIKTVIQDKADSFRRVGARARGDKSAEIDESDEE